MSGIVGIITFGGQPLDKQLLRTITESMRFRGPDACEILSSANFGFGHTLLRTSSESTGEKQPLNLNQKVWLTADARIDGRAELIAKLSELNAREERSHEDPSDAELILRAYLAWGEECVAHLIGDFSFAILDLEKQRLFCARDHFGIKPFYYARSGKSFIFSNPIETIQLHPEVTARLNDQAIGDLLLFDFNRDPNRTSFQDISRLPPAHTLTLDLTTGECRIKRYWSSPEAVTLRYRNQSEYLEHFQDLFTRAVEDRIRTNRLQSFLSGGLDSTGIAREVVRIRQRLNRDLSLTGQCVVYRELMDDQEGHFASIAAEALGIPLYYVVADPYLLYEDAGAPELLKPEPVHEPLQKLTYHQFSKIQADCRVALSGLGPDATMSFWLHSHIASMKSNSRLAELTMDLIRYFWLKRRPPRLHVLDRLGRTPGPQTLSDTYPRWLNKKFEERLELNNREVLLQSKEMGSHFRRKQAFQLLSDPGNWTYHFEYADSGTTRLPVEV
ncbi:MAG TPA: asparagine synthase-related protein, partial [Pyrinomonadaceae bacterium]|nr:asparagine synthase-related protein [Pyrinomonadaceae bacterium]